MDVSQFIDSPEMREHLKDIQLSERVCEELVCGAPRPLADKVAWLEHRGSNLTRETKRALHSLELTPGEFLFLVEEWYDFDSCGRSTSYSYYGMPFPSLEPALSHIRQVMAEEEWNNDSLFWTKLDKFMLGKDGVYHHLYTYYLIKDEVVYFETNPSRPQNCFCGAPDLNVPIPFKAGDIVAIDCKPFMPPKPVVLLEVDNADCCGVTCLFQREEDREWEVGSVKHSRCWSGLRSYPIISPLYRLASFRDKLGENERLLEKVSKYLDGDVEKGRDLWENLNQEMNRLDREWFDEQEILGFLK